MSTGIPREEAGISIEIFGRLITPPFSSIVTAGYTQVLSFCSAKILKLVAF